MDVTQNKDQNRCSTAVRKAAECLKQYDGEKQTCCHTNHEGEDNTMSLQTSVGEKPSPRVYRHTDSDDGLPAAAMPTKLLPRLPNFCLVKDTRHAYNPSH